MIYGTDKLLLEIDEEERERIVAAHAYAKKEFRRERFKRRLWYVLAGSVIVAFCAFILWGIGR